MENARAEAFRAGCDITQRSIARQLSNTAHAIRTNDSETLLRQWQAKTVTETKTMTDLMVNVFHRSGSAAA